MAHILAVDDDPDLCTLLKTALERDGHAVEIRTSGVTVTESLCRWADCILLDVMMPGEDGFATCRRIRAITQAPILFLTARTDEQSVLTGLGIGADDYLTKPFLMQELLLRVQHLLQRAYRTELSRTKAAILQLGDRSVDLHDALVTLPDGTTLALTATERTLLRKLAENRGHIVTYDALCEAVWGADYYGYENSLGVHIRHLREKLEPEPGRPRFLQTVRGIGYKLAKEDAR